MSKKKEVKEIIEANDWRIKAKLLTTLYAPSFVVGLIGSNKTYTKTQADLARACVLLNTKI